MGFEAKAKAEILSGLAQANTERQRDRQTFSSLSCHSHKTKASWGSFIVVRYLYRVIFTWRTKALKLFYGIILSDSTKNILAATYNLLSAECSSMSTSKGGTLAPPWLCGKNFDSRTFMN